MATFNFVTRASAQIKRDTSRSVSEYLPTPMTEMTLTSTLESAFLAVDALSWRASCVMLQKLPQRTLLAMTELMSDLSLVAEKVSRLKRYKTPACSICCDYVAVRNDRHEVLDYVPIIK